MALTPPEYAISPQSRIKKVHVLHDGTQSPHNEFSIAKLELHGEDPVFGIRWDRNSWSDGAEEKGYPAPRGNPSWFILPPNITEFINVMNTLDFS